jgi:hypothetical protein
LSEETTGPRRRVAEEVFADMSREEIIAAALAICDAADDQDKYIHQLIDAATALDGLVGKLVAYATALNRTIDTSAQALQRAADAQATHHKKLAREFVDCARSGLVEQSGIEFPEIERIDTSSWPRPKRSFPLDAPSP